GRRGPRGPQVDAASVVMTGADLRKWRRQVGLSQAELARRLGYSNHTVCHWELGDKRVPPAHYRRILEELLKARSELEALRRYRQQMEGTTEEVAEAAS
ncbi:MAG TPA: helix-turn-helix transcriptional regulator, partial [Ktedonobacterales bacterium]|nr:helix-turn-helix transcriptional regulator [Ktedonobacterales bacterium]